MVGLQWGDEGKGKVVDVLTERADAVIRYQGGANAGHTVYVGERKFVLHHLPSGVLRSNTLAILGNGMVVEPRTLMEEVSRLDPEARERIYVSERAHLVLPQHVALDRAREGASARPIGTTLRGIGPTYEAKYARSGLRVGDLRRRDFLRDEFPERLRAAGVSDAEEIDRARSDCQRLLDDLGGRIVDAQALLQDLDAKGARFLFEGAQGSLLDVDFGTYPFVTSSTPSFLGLGPGTGFSPRRIDHVLGVTKVYCTRVGEGPFPSEVHGETANQLRTAGGEFGSTTGRPRRCGWLDLPALRFAIQLNDVDSLALTKADVLAGRDTVPVVVGYRRGGVVANGIPFDARDFDGVEAIVEQWPGWSVATPEAMAPFTALLERHLERRVSVLSTGRMRSDVVLRAPFGIDAAPAPDSEPWRPR
ncbi:MAG: adenylosuccinate synthase [Planctomycetota bacterium]